MYGLKYAPKLGKPFMIEKNQKLKLDSARRQRRIYLLDPDDQEYRETLQNAKVILERLVDAAMPCKRSPIDITIVVAKVEIASEKMPKTVHECIVESHESTWQRVEPSPPKNTKIRWQAKDLLR